MSSQCACSAVTDHINQVPNIVKRLVTFILEDPNRQYNNTPVLFICEFISLYTSLYNQTYSDNIVTCNDFDNYDFKSIVKWLTQQNIYYLNSLHDMVHQIHQGVQYIPYMKRIQASGNTLLAKRFIVVLKTI